MEITKFREEAEKHHTLHKKTLLKLKSKKPRLLDELFTSYHNDFFENNNCLDCANCCKTTSPIFLETDIERIAKVVKLKVSVFINTYLHKDEEGDYVLNNAPCPFLGFDNKCIVYDSRPKACREYPHTNRKRMHQILKISLKNTLICPAVHEIFKRLATI